VELPRHLRFARAIALVSGLTACGGSSAPPPAAPVATRPPPATRVDPCSTCVCWATTTNPPSCYDTNRGACCDSVAVEGPLPPPDLPSA
jgi:hypothetical protein